MSGTKLFRFLHFQELSVHGNHTIFAQLFAMFERLINRAGATIRRTRRLPRALGQRVRQKGQKYNYMVQKVTTVHQEKIMCVMKVNETHVHVVMRR